MCYFFIRIKQVLIHEGVRFGSFSVFCMLLDIRHLSKYPSILKHVLYHTLHVGLAWIVQTPALTEEQVISMLEFLIDNIFAEFRGRFFQQLSAFLWKRTVPLSLPTFSYFHMNRSSFRHLSKTRRSKKPCHVIRHSDILMMFFPLTIQTFLIKVY